ncbi:hypothetical protein ACU686_09515 [Yinghuangia aomiensis]
MKQDFDRLPPGKRRRLLARVALRPLLTATGLLLIYYLFPLEGPYSAGAAVALAIGVLLVFGLVAWQARVITRSRYPRLKGVETLVTAFFLFIVLFATAYDLMAANQSGAFTQDHGPHRLALLHDDGVFDRRFRRHRAQVDECPGRHDGADARRSAARRCGCPCHPQRRPGEPPPLRAERPLPTASRLRPRPIPAAGPKPAKVLVPRADDVPFSWGTRVGRRWLLGRRHPDHSRACPGPIAGTQSASLRGRRRSGRRRCSMPRSGSVRGDDQDGEAESACGNKDRSSARALVVVDDLEVGHLCGTLTLRCGSDHDRTPLCVAVPAEMTEQLLQAAHEASSDAEEEWWNLVPPLMRHAGTTDPQVAFDAMRRWLLSVPSWESLLGAMPLGHGGIALLTHVGHVGLVVQPTQLQHLAPDLAEAAAGAVREEAAARPTPAPGRSAAALRLLRRRTWPRQARQVDPDLMREAAMRHRAAFLARPPHSRPAANTVTW